VAVLELHTFSSLNPQFLPQYKNALRDADIKIVYYSPHTLAIKKLPDLSPELLTYFFDDPGLVITTSVDDLEKSIREIELKQFTILLWMSSGRFDGLDISEISECIDRKT